MAAGEDDFDLLSPAERADLAAAITPKLAAFAGEAALDVGAEVERFIALYDDRPCKDNKGGCRFASCVSVYLAARMVDPALIIESGTFQGQTAWVLRQACPEAEIRCYDIDLSNLAWRPDDIVFAERDWTEDAITAPAGRSLIFFDDHVSHARRIVEAHARGFRTLLMDDDYPADQLGLTGVPPAPTVSMILDDDLPWGETLEWTRKGKTRSLRLDPADRDRALALIEEANALPDLGSIGGLPRNRRQRLVRLRP